MDNKGDNITLDRLPKDEGRVFGELAAGNMIVAQSENDFLYILDFDGKYHMFSHTPGNASGGQKQFPKNEKYEASVRKIIDLADTVFVAEFDKSMNLYNVMASAEEGILTMFPGDDRDADGDVEFIIPTKGEDTDDSKDKD